MSLKVAIIGAGVGGLAAAVLLHQAGLEVVVYEQASELGPVGAGLMASPNMTRILARLGLAAELDKWAVPLEATWEYRRWLNGRILASQPMGEHCRTLYGTDCYSVHRADLVWMLATLLPDPVVQLDSRCTGLRQNPASGGMVELSFTDRAGRQSAAVADVVVGADGIHSVVREMLALQAPAWSSGLAAYRCLVPAAAAPQWAHQPVHTIWLGPGRVLVHYPISGGKLINVVGVVPAGNQRIESWSAPGDPAVLAGHFAGWDDQARDLLAAATDTDTIQWALFDRDPLPRWSSGRATLLGDAAHAALPWLAQGAAQAVEDAAVLAHCLSLADRTTLPQALELYQHIRLPRTTRLQRASRAIAAPSLLADGPDQRHRDAALATGQPLRQIEWLYGHDVTAHLPATLTP